MRSLMIGIAVIFCGTAIAGCGVDIGEIAPKAEERIFQDGQIYILNNLRPREHEPRVLLIVYEAQEFYVPHNMTYDGEPTLVGAMPITPESLPGGTQVDFDYKVMIGSDLTPGRLSKVLGEPVVIDGDVTIEFYEMTWEEAGSWWHHVPVDVNVFPGKFDSVHDYE